MSSTDSAAWDKIIYPPKESSNILDTIEKRTGLKGLVPVGKPLEGYYVYESDQEGSITIIPTSDENIEEDLAQIERGETILGIERHNQIIHESFVATIKFLGKYLDPAVVQEFFPRLDIANPDSYNFLNSRIKIVVLSEEDFDFLQETSQDSKDSKGWTTYVSQPVATAILDTQRIKISPKSIIVVDEQVGEFLLRKHHYRVPARGSNEYTAMCTFYLRKSIIHEIVHQFSIGSQLSSALREGLTEFYSQMIDQTASTSRETSAQFNNLNLTAYRYETEFIALIIDALLQLGLKLDEVNKAIISRNTDSTARIEKTLDTRFGHGTYNNVIGSVFGNATERLEYARHLNEQVTGHKIQSIQISIKSAQRAIDIIEGIFDYFVRPYMAYPKPVEAIQSIIQREDRWTEQDKD